MSGSINARWRKPALPEAVDTTYDWATADTGRPTLDASVRFSPDDVERFRTGYLCIKCWEPQTEPFPERCALPQCRFEMRRLQAEEFARQFKGTQRNPRAVLIENELEKLDDKHERNFHVTKTGIVVPAWVKT